MLAIVGVLLVVGMVFGGYVLAGGKFGVILKALPFELMMIGGAAIGSFLIANKGDVAKGALLDLRRVISGPHWRQEDYRDLLSLMFMIVKLLKLKGPLAIEAHVDNPRDSVLFGRFPRIRDDHFALAFMADTLRMMTMSMDDPYQIEECMQRQLKKHHAELHARAAALQSMADAMPALGIVAAVLGVVKTMAAIDQPVTILGAMIAGALVGTFLGVFLSYGFVGPIAAKISQSYEEDAQFYAIIRDCLVAYLHGHSAPIAVELARGNVPTTLQPSFQAMDEILSALPADPLAA
ncbi:flagellar motor stator protein MotA [Benzoatithermus flavus]|uniref:Flagellar motor stator protein MotA n=1 Tax=Benzoatithermus flavus TaxID=3108223 RepID=A0ABU8XVN6_9PROT